MKYEKILVTGGNGMVGTALKSLIPGASFCGRRDCNLVYQEGFVDFMDRLESERPDAIIHLAAKVGGISANTNYVAEFCTENMRINENVLKAAKVRGIEKVVSVLSTCIYPDKAVYPLTEDQLHNGPPHSSNFGYAYAKRMLDVLSRAYRQQYGCNFVTVVPNNIFGINDSFGREDSHVIPGMIRKMHDAEGGDVTLWGDGSPLREFTYSQDIARAILFVLDHYNEAEPINIGTTEEHSIREVADLVAKFMGFRGKILWDESKPNGQLRKPSSNEKFLQLGWNRDNYSVFSSALKTTCNWYLCNYPLIRGVS